MYTKDENPAGTDEKVTS